VRPLRVLHAPAAVGGHPTGLAAAERELGLESTVVTLNEPPFGYRVDRVLAPRGTSTAVREWRRWRAVAAARHADVVHFNFGTSLAPAYHGSDTRRPFRVYARLLEQRDLSLLSRAGCALFVTFQGDDVRPSGDHQQDALKRRRAERFARVADRLYVLNPDLLAHVPGAEFLPYANVDPREWTPVPPRANGPLRVVHAPSDRARKGTEAILAAVERAPNVELDLVEGRLHADARRALEQADVLVDQVVVGWYGGVAVEAMALGKPVLAYIDHAQLEAIPGEMRDQLPVVHANAESLPDVLRRLAGEDLAELGRRSRAYVERWHDPLRIAERTKADYELAARR
jgi:hypothetical protein